MSMKMNRSKLSTPTIAASDAILVLAAETQIDAPAQVVFRAIRNTDTWRDWNRFVPKVSIQYQPPEEDSATTAEIQEIVRNTSIAGTFYSDLTDGGVGTPRQRDPDEQPPPRLRLNSNASRGSSDQQNRLSSEAGPRASISSAGGRPGPSGAQMYQEAQNSRRNSLASGGEPEPVSNQLANRNPHRASIAMPPASPGRKGSTKPKYTQTVGPTTKSLERAHAAMMSVYGEPSVRLQIKTKLTLYTRMKPMSPSDFVEVSVVVIDVARPDDPVSEKGTTALTRSKTHHLGKNGIYRVIWANDTGTSSIANLLKGQIQAERVHEIEPTGAETCVYRTWELQKGHAAKSNKKKHGEYLQKMTEVWCSGLRDFCEGLHAPKIDRRDFSITEEDVPAVIRALA